MELNFNWRKASGNDVNNIVELCGHQFRDEMKGIFDVCDQGYTQAHNAFSRNTTFAVVNQFYNPNQELVMVCHDDDGEFMAYTWAHTRERAIWSDELVCNIVMAHINMKLSPKTRVKIVSDMITLWDVFAVGSGSAVICSNTVRGDQTAFLKMHERRGYTVRGSYAYKRVLPIPASSVNPQE